MASPLELASSSLYTNNIPHEIGGSALDDSTLKALYKFNTGALTTDSSGEGHTLTAISDPAEGTGMSGVFGTCADFDGNDAYSATDHADFKPTGVFSVSAWVKTTTTSGNYYFQSYSISDSSKKAGWLVGTRADGTVQFYIGKNTGTTANVDYIVLNSNATVNDGYWHLVVMVWDGTYMRIYIDGYEDTSVSGFAAAYASGTNYVRVGCLNQSGTNASFFTGSLDDVALWNGKALTASEIQTMYGKLSAYYRFSTGALTYDSSYHSNVLTAVSDPAADSGGMFGYAVALDGDDAYSLVDAKKLKPTGNFSVGGWVKFTGSTSSIQMFFYSAYYDTDVYGFWMGCTTSGRVYFVSGKGTGASKGTDYDYPATSIHIDDDAAWHFIVGVYDGSYLYAYVDGVLDAKIAWTSAPVYYTTNNVNIACQQRISTRTAFFTGSMDDWFLFNGKALTGYEVSSLYRETKKVGSVPYYNKKKIAGVTISNDKKIAGVA